jgi:superoxide dismutase, Cu-Zn family
MHRNSSILVAAAFALSVAGGCGGSNPPAAPGTAEPQRAPGARALLKNAKGETVGSATFTQASGGVTIEVHANGLPPGQHGIHIHDAGRCDPPDFKSSGPHFNPGGKQHGSMNPMGKHAGDLGNLTVAESGHGMLTVTSADYTLGDGASSLFHTGGTSIMIHADPDDNKTDPSGNSGARIACGVIAKE